MVNTTRRFALFVLLLGSTVVSCRKPPDRSTVDVVTTPVSDAAFSDRVGMRGNIVIGATFAGGTPLASATVRLASASGDVREARTDAAGRFEIGAIPAGAYEMEVAVPRDTTEVRRRVTMALQPVRFVIPSGAGRVDVQLLARYLPGSVRLIAAVDLITADR
jgi:hypothetical protein